MQVGRGAEGIRIDAHADVDAPPSIAWAVLSDYDHLAEFVPHMRVSRVVSRPGEPLRIEQRGETRWLGFRRSVDVVFAIDETPPSRLAFHAVAGSFRRMEGEWRVEPRESGARIVYRAEMLPDFWIPPFVGPALVARDVTARVAAVAREIRRRAAHPLR